MTSNKQCKEEQKVQVRILNMCISEASDISDSEDEEREVELTVESSSKHVVNLGTKTKSTVSSWLDSGLSEVSGDKDDIQKQIDMIPDKIVRGIMQRKHKAMILSKSNSITNPEVFIHSLMKEMTKSEKIKRK